MYELWIQLWRIYWFKAIVLNINKRKYEYNIRPPLWSKWSEFLATDTEVSVSIPGATRFSE